MAGKGYPIRGVRVPWTMCVALLLVVCCCWLCGSVQAQPPGVTLPSPFPPPGAVIPPAPPAPSADQAILVLQQQVLGLTNNITASLEKEYSFCITNG